MRIALPAALLLPLFLAGCALSPTAAPTPDAGAAIQGRVHGGQQAIAGARVYLYAASYGGVGGFSFSLLNSNVITNNPSNHGQDAGGGSYYVTTDSNGMFSITGDYVCGVNEQLYLYAVGGDSGGGPNSAIGLLAALGTCPNSGSIAANVPFVAIDEVSTIAAAYALAGFATDATNVSSSGTGLAQTGIVNAFANANRLENIATGQALATTPSGNGTVPQATINTLANILASCINSAGTFSSCSTLFSNARSAGATGTIPTDTANAAINIAHNPGANVSTLFGLSTPSAPFSPALPLNTTPNDFTLGINFTGGGLLGPEAIAIDASGDVWISNSGEGGVVELSSAGVFISPVNGYFDHSQQLSSFAIAIDPSGNAWVANVYANSISEFSSAGVAATSSPFTTASLSSPEWLAIDGSGNVWVASYGADNLTEFSNAGADLSGANGYTGGGLTQPWADAIDGAGDVWVDSLGAAISKFTNAGAAMSGTNGYAVGGYANAIAMDHFGDAWITSPPSTLYELSSTGTVLSGMYGYSGGGLNTPNSIAIDGAGNAWIANGAATNPGTISEFSNAGAPLSPSTGYASGGMYETAGIAIDGSGDAWMVNSGNNSITEMIGVAAPVVTPISAAVKTNTVGQRP